MDATLASIPIIDVDTHFTEPPDFWSRQVPASLKGREPRVVVNEAGRQMWIVDDDLRLGSPGFCVVRQDGSKLRGEITLESFEEMTPAAMEPKARLETMDRFGLSAQILYPNILGFAGNFIMKVEDRALRDFCITAYNDGMAEIQEAGEGRLFPQALIPFWDPAAALRELERCADELKLTGFVLSDSTELWGLPALSDESWTPLFEFAEDRGLPVNFHIGSGQFGGGPWPSTGPRMLAAMSTMAQLNNMRCIVNLIFSGVLDRHPKLQFVSVESGLGWIPFLLECSAYQAYENGADLALTPHEYFQRNIHASFWFERDNVAHAIEYLGTDNVMFETDFPHPTCLYPHVAEQVQAALGGFSPEIQHKILHENATRLYGIELQDAA